MDKTYQRLCHVGKYLSVELVFQMYSEIPISLLHHQNSFEECHSLLVQLPVIPKKIF